MTPQLPLPVRVAAGLVATAVEQARDLPRLALELPVTAVSQALQASMRVQQKVTELAIKGDRVLGMGPSIEDEPPWATFDDDLPPRRNGRTGDAPTKITTLRSVDLFAEPGPVEPASVDPEPAPAPAPGGTTPPAPSPAAGEDGPQVLPGYSSLTIPQLRGKLRHLSVDDLRALLAWEQAHGDRPPYVTMLSNRIAAVTEG
ncbi:MAG TPA: lipid droplet-associated protein [Pseudonocardia sp.]|nr:lipid droplet-associated protein [Pseudonocardia sp.]